MLGDYHVKIWVMAVLLMLGSLWFFATHVSTEQRTIRQSCLSVILRQPTPPGWFKSVKLMPHNTLLCRIAIRLRNERDARGETHGN